VQCCVADAASAARSSARSGAVARRRAASAHPLHAMASAEMNGDDARRAVDLFTLCESLKARARAERIGSSAALR
jgi:hypothetical protein